MKPLLLDLFCCEGGAATGYARAGFDVVGVDIDPQPRYPFRFIQGDALDVLGRLLAGDEVNGLTLDQVAAIHASPPCQRFSTSTSSTGSPDNHPDLIDPTRDLLNESLVPYIIENVGRSPLRRDLMLCGSMFGMKVRRHRVFEMGGWLVEGQPSCAHARQGRTVDVTGHAGGRNQTDRPKFPVKYYDADHAREVMGMPWASGRGCTEAIPPAYTEWIGTQLLELLPTSKEPT